MSERAQKMDLMAAPGGGAPGSNLALARVCSITCRDGSITSCGGVPSFTRLLPQAISLSSSAAAGPAARMHAITRMHMIIRLGIPCFVSPSRKFSVYCKPGQRKLQMKLPADMPILAFLIIATALEVSGDALIRKSLFEHAGWARLALFLLGAVLLAGYGTFLNLSPLEFGQVVGPY